MKRFRGGLVFKAHRLLYHFRLESNKEVFKAHRLLYLRLIDFCTNVGLRVIKKKKKIVCFGSSPPLSHKFRVPLCLVLRPGLWFMVCGVWFIVYCLWFMVYGLWFMVYGLWFMVYGL